MIVILSNTVFVLCPDLYNIHFNTIDFILFSGLSPGVQSNGSNTLPRSSNHSVISESPFKCVASSSQAAQSVATAVPGGGNSRRNSNTGGSQTTGGSNVDTPTPSTTPSIPRRSSFGVDGSTKINGRGNLVFIFHIFIMVVLSIFILVSQDLLIFV